jgi:hypothetical protein
MGDIFEEVGEAEQKKAAAKAIQTGQRPGNFYSFLKVLFTRSLYRKYTRALTFENVSASRGPEYPRHVMLLPWACKANTGGAGGRRRRQRRSGSAGDVG